jgi:hypothetical protein
MARYRIYAVTESGRIASAPVAVECDDDQAAIEHARGINDGLDLELWEGRREVAMLKGEQRE